MRRIWNGGPGPAISVVALALVAAVAGTAVAGPNAETSGKAGDALKKAKKALRKTKQNKGAIEDIELTPGPQGIPGPPGEQGIPGPQGLKGDTGDPGPTLFGTAVDLTSAAIAADTCGDYGTITVVDAGIGDTAVATPDADSSSNGIEDNNLSWSATVTAKDTVTIRACNPTVSAIDTDNDQEWRADIWN